MMEKSNLIFISEIIALIIIVFRNFLYLVITPYKAIRNISQHSRFSECLVIFLLVFLYFNYASAIRTQSFHPLVITSSAIQSFSYFILTFYITVCFFKLISILFNLKTTILSLTTTFAYSLLPTLIWFYVTSSLFILFPPPRGENFWGLSLSLIFVVFSLSLLLWRIILLYLSLRFATKASFGQIILMILFFMTWFLPASYAMYFLHIFRVPFI